MLVVFCYGTYCLIQKYVDCFEKVNACSKTADNLIKITNLFSLVFWQDLFFTNLIVSRRYKIPFYSVMKIQHVHGYQNEVKSTSRKTTGL